MAHPPSIHMGCDGTISAAPPALAFPSAPRKATGSNQPLQGRAALPGSPGRLPTAVVGSRSSQPLGGRPTSAWQHGSSTPTLPGQPGHGESCVGNEGKGKHALSQAAGISEGKGAGWPQVAPAPLTDRLSHALARQQSGVVRLQGTQLFPRRKRTKVPSPVPGERDYLAPVPKRPRRTPGSEGYTCGPLPLPAKSKSCWRV